MCALFLFKLWDMTYIIMDFFIKLFSLIKEYIEVITSIIGIIGIIYTGISIIYEKFIEIENLKISLISLQEVVINNNEKILLLELSSIEREISILSEKRSLTPAENARLINLLVKKELISKEVINKNGK